MTMAAGNDPIIHSIPSSNNNNKQQQQPLQRTNSAAITTPNPASTKRTPSIINE
jgi:hypothetical protein